MTVAWIFTIKFELFTLHNCWFKNKIVNTCDAVVTQDSTLLLACRSFDNTDLDHVLSLSARNRNSTQKKSDSCFNKKHTLENRHKEAKKIVANRSNKNSRQGERGAWAGESGRQ